MKETYISLETAKLAREKKLPFFYDLGTNCTCYKLSEPKHVLSYHMHFEGPDKLEYISAPTQSLLQKWLREVHKIEVLIEADCCQQNFEYGYDFYIWNKNDADEFWSAPDNGNSTYKTYEEALEDGLKYVLNLIK